MFWNRVTDTYSNYGFKHVGLLLLLALYSAIGGVVFRALESGHEEEHLTQIAATSMLAKNDLKSNLRSIFFNYSLSEDMKVILTEEAIKSYDAKMGTRIINVENDRQWTVWGGLYYAGTIYTSIGYGDISAKTTGGRIATVIYAIFGIPLVITILNDWGSLLFILMQKMWNRYLISCFDWMASIMPIACRQRCRSILPSRMEESFSGKHHHDDGHTLPLKFVVFLLIFWVMLCAAIFCIFQPNWNYATSLYFFFISLTTIGLGDIVPDHKVAVLSFLLILIGLSVVSMSISVIQVKLELLFNRIISSMDHDFKNNLDKQNGSAKSRDQSVGKGTPSDEKKPTQKGHPATLGVIQQYSNAMKFTDKLLLKFMGSHRKKILTDRYDEKSKLRNSWTQTDRRGFYDMSVQTGDERQAKGIPVFEDIKSNLRFGRKKSYIYNVGD
uniref:Potassium channel domain-containing protein n=1 Tax=Plectus sambesii TaxID=2011161 RepID=A0A914UNA6_9BILA